MDTDKQILSDVHSLSSIKTPGPDNEVRELKILNERLWHFTSVGMGNCRAAQRVRREIECRLALNSPGLRSTFEGGSTLRLSNSQTVNRTAPLAPRPSPLASLEQLTAGLAHLESVGLAKGSG